MSVSITIEHFMRRALRQYARRTCLVCEGVELTYEELDRRSDALASAFVEAGLRPGDRLAILLKTCPEFYVAELASMKLGLLKVPLNPRLGTPEALQILNECQAAGVITDAPGMIADHRAELPALLEIFAVGSKAPGTVSMYEAMQAAPMREIHSPARPDDACTLVFSSGSTGKPKGILHSGANVVHCALSAIREFEFTREERVLVPTHPAHGHNFIYPGLIAMGATLFLLPKYSPEGVLAGIQEHRINRLHMVPTMWYGVFDSPDLDRYDLRSLRSCNYASAPMSVQKLIRGLEIFGPKFTQAYCCGESPLIMTILRKAEHSVDDPELLRSRLASCGREALDVELRIVDDDGAPVGPGEAGEIILRNPAAMLGYWNQPELTREVLRDGWVHTGDIGRRDEEGFVYLVDRKQDKVITGGLNVYPSEVERVIAQYPAVDEVAVAGIPDDYWGESIAAFVKLKPGHPCTVEQILAHCEAHLARFKRPRTVAFVDDLPKNANGKISRRALREPFWRGRGRQIA